MTKDFTVRAIRALASIVACLSMSLVLMAGTPSAPSRLCVQSNGKSSCASGSSARKWNPGHYVRANALGFPENDATRQSVYDLTRNNPLFKGGLITVTWGEVEPIEGQYDFSQIDKDLAYLKSMGKMLIIEVWWQKYGGDVNARYFPQYIIDAGGIGSIPSQNEHHVLINEQQWADRYIALQRALAARYDGDPGVEQVVITETASTSAYEFKYIVPAVAAFWSKTAVVLYMNWVDTPELARDLMAICAQNAVGVGGPDILPPKPISPTGEDNGSRALRGVGRDSLYSDGTNIGDFGSIDYRGRIPVSYSYEALFNIPPSALIGYAMNTLKATHIVWGVNNSLPAGQDWPTGVLPTVQSVSGLTSTAMPTAFLGN